MRKDARTAKKELKEQKEKERRKKLRRKIEPVVVEVAPADEDPKEEERELQELADKIQADKKHQAFGDPLAAYRWAKHQRMKEQAEKAFMDAKQDALDTENNEFLKRIRERAEADPLKNVARKASIVDFEGKSERCGCFSYEEACVHGFTSNPLSIGCFVLVMIVIIVLIVVENACSKQGSTMFTAGQDQCLG